MFAGAMKNEQGDRKEPGGSEEKLKCWFGFLCFYELKEML